MRDTSSDGVEPGSLRIAESSSVWTPRYLYAVASIFVTTVLVSNLAATKVFALGPATFTAGILVFPISYIFGDILTEVYGFNRARRVIYLGLLANVFMAGVMWLAIYLPPASGWHLQHEFEAIYRLIPRIVIGSLAGYVAGELVNSLIMSVLKVRTKGRHLWIRTISSTLLGQFVDTVVFVVVAFAGVFAPPLLVAATISAWIFKVSYEVVATPLTYLIVWKLKRLEGIEHFDKQEKRRLLRF